MTSRDVAKVLYELETFLELHGENEFKTRAYGRAARALETSMVDIEAAVTSGGDPGIPGVGKALIEEIRQIVETGTVLQLEELRRETPPGLLDMLKIKGLGAKKVRAIHTSLGIDTLSALELAAAEGRIASLAGFGKKSQENILVGIEELKENLGKFRINTATTIAEEFLMALESLPSVERAAIAGRLRRGGEQFESLSFVAAARSIESLRSELEREGLLRELAREEDLIQGLTEDLMPVHIYVAPPEGYYVALHQRTGASDYRFMISIPLHDRGYDLTERELLRDGAPVGLSSEEELFELAGMQFIPPELREGVDEVRRAIDGELPELIEEEDLRGMMHVHSTWSDGRSSLTELAEHVSSLGYRYLLICDHSKSASYANGLDEFRLEAQGKEIDEVNKGYDPAEFRMLKGTECDILADGSLDLSDDCLASLDGVVISIHSRFELSTEAQTERLCRALEHPCSTILGHSTGRLILKRKGYEIDFRQVIAAAAEHGKSIEINCNPLRLDLNWRMAKYAGRKGVKIAINPDAHSLADFGNMRYGITMARKAWLTKETVLNTMSAEEFLGFTQSSRLRLGTIMDGPTGAGRTT